MIKEMFTQRIKRGFLRRLNNLMIAGMAKQVAQHAPTPRGQPVVFFKASTGIDDLSWNSGFHLLTSWGFRLRGVPVIFFGCKAGMSRCVLGTDRDNPQKAPPCKSCIYQSKTLYTEADTRWFTFDRDRELENALRDLGLEELSRFKWKMDGGEIPLGELCLPGLRWILRMRNLEDNEKTRFLLREYISSAWNIAQKFTKILVETNPRTVIVFNGQFFPEAAARWVAQNHKLRVITHEVGLQPASAFYTEGEATAYPIRIPDEFELRAEQNKRLDAYLEKRFQGQFSMAGIQFWPAMRGLDDAFLRTASAFERIVPIFTNVIFDTSQAHADTVFRDMFAWLDLVLQTIPSYPKILFVIRAHPDETRIRKESRETVQKWLEESGVQKMENVLFVAPKASLSSYELIQRSKFVMVYNSTIGLEASIMGVPVLCAGRARFTQYPTVFFPQTVGEYQSKLQEFLKAGKIEVPLEFKRNARRFLYYQLFRTSLPFDDYLIPGVRTTQARLKSFDLELLTPERSPAIRAVLKGVLDNGDFLLEE
jgi:Capsule polysaccharide biosynthesis protein